MYYQLKDKMNLDLKMEPFLFTNVPKGQAQNNKCQAPPYSMLRQDLQNLLQECKRVKRNVCRKLENKEDLLGGSCWPAKGPVCPLPHYRGRAGHSLFPSPKPSERHLKAMPAGFHPLFPTALDVTRSLRPARFLWGTSFFSKDSS